MVVSQYSHYAHDTAKLSVQARVVTRPGERAAGCCDTARGEQAGTRADAQGRTERPHRARNRGARHRCWACCWQTGCALGALSLFLTRFDSVLFLSQFLDIVREPGS